MPWSLERRRWKKLPYWHGLERPNLSHAAALHATSEPEAEQLTRLFPDTPVLTVPNAVEVETPTPGLARERGRIVFVGRLHPVKGFDVLIPAMSLLTARVPHAELVLAGPDDHGEWSRIKAAIERCEPRPKVRYVGSVHGRVKADLLGSAEALVLCSHLESFGNVVAEALAVGTPVVVGRRCPWRSVEEEGAGYWVEHTARGVADGLERLLSASDGGNRLRANARRLGATYTAAAIGKTMAHHYERLLDVPARRNEAPC